MFNNRHQFVLTNNETSQRLSLIRLVLSVQSRDQQNFSQRHEVSLMDLSSPPNKLEQLLLWSPLLVMLAMVVDVKGVLWGYSFMEQAVLFLLMSLAMSSSYMQHRFFRRVRGLVVSIASSYAEAGIIPSEQRATVVTGEIATIEVSETQKKALDSLTFGIDQLALQCTLASTWLRLFCKITILCMGWGYILFSFNAEQPDFVFDVIMLSLLVCINGWLTLGRYVSPLRPIARLRLPCDRKGVVEKAGEVTITLHDKGPYLGRKNDYPQLVGLRFSPEQVFDRAYPSSGADAVISA